jgi:hypothetical protein
VVTVYHIWEEGVFLRAGLVAIFSPGVVIEEMQCSTSCASASNATHGWQMLDIN